MSIKLCANHGLRELAYKLPELEVNKLLETGSAKPLKYIEKGHIKNGYAMFENPESSKKGHWKNYVLKAIGHNST